jgi:hypothetical protein
VVCLSYVKVCEFQRRGLVHLHSIVRLDASEPAQAPPPDGFDTDLLVLALRSGITRARLPFPPAAQRPGDLVCFGSDSGIDVAELSLSSDSGERIAGYLGKYAVKAVASGLECRIKSRDQIAKLGLPPHLRTMVETAWYLGGDRELAKLGLRRFAHQLGHPGRVLTYSRHWSTTFGDLRNARAKWRRQHPLEDDQFVAEEDGWRFIGIGYDSPATSELARALADLDRQNRLLRARPEAIKVGVEGPA